MKARCVLDAEFVLSTEGSMFSGLPVRAELGVWMVQCLVRSYKV